MITNSYFNYIKDITWNKKMYIRIEFNNLLWLTIKGKSYCLVIKTKIGFIRLTNTIFYRAERFNEIQS